jgi:hypothetical protein
MYSYFFVKGGISDLYTFFAMPASVPYAMITVPKLLAGSFRRTLPTQLSPLSGAVIPARQAM